MQMQLSEGIPFSRFVHVILLMAPLRDLNEFWNRSQFQDGIPIDAPENYVFK